MTFAGSCPGSRAVREPTPEYINCPSCGEEVEVWTHEASYPCHNCGTRVFREQSPSCIDWCPHAEECIGPEVYQSLKPETEKGPDGTGRITPIDILNQEHDEVLRQISLLRGATLCLRLGARASAPQPSKALGQGLSNLSQVLDFFDNELRLHFRREEQGLFPILEKHIGREGSPTQLLVTEHAQLRQWLDRLNGKTGEFQKGHGQDRAIAATEIYEIGSHTAGLLRGHIDKESASLLPIARSLLGEEDLAEISGKWQSLGV